MLKYHRKKIDITLFLTAAVIFSAACFFAVSAESILIYDEEKGIISVEKDKAAPQKTGKSASSKSAVKRPSASLKATTPFKDIHANRKDDPPELYFKSGLKYFEKHDYSNALKNFERALDKGREPLYLLWIGKTYRRMGDNNNMLRITDRIRTHYPESDVADDALFETAFYYQKQNEYHKAIMKYKELAEQYPFGTAYSNGNPFLEVSRDQRRMMKAEMLSTLKILGYADPLLENRYIAFQKTHGLPVTGKADRATVQKIKKEYENMLDKDRKKSYLNRKTDRLFKLLYVIAGLTLISFISIITVKIKLKSIRQHYISLHNILSDLSTDKI